MVASLAMVCHMQCTTAVCRMLLLMSTHLAAAVVSRASLSTAHEDRSTY
jgi:hypothetical protein